MGSPSFSRPRVRRLVNGGTPRGSELLGSRRNDALQGIQRTKDVRKDGLGRSEPVIDSAKYRHAGSAWHRDRRTVLAVERYAGEAPAFL